MTDAGTVLEKVIDTTLRQSGVIELSGLTALVRKRVHDVTRTEVLQILMDGEGRRFACSKQGWTVVSDDRATTSDHANSKALRGGVSKQHVVDELCQTLGLGSISLGPGSTEPKRLLVESAAALGVAVRTRATKLVIARQIVEISGLSWLSSFDSTDQPSGGGGTITTDGLKGVLEAAQLLRAKQAVTVVSDAPSDPPTESPVGGKRNPRWVMDEVLLALDLYFGIGLVGPADLQVIALSELLNALPIHETASKYNKFRNPRGVAMKLANFAALDPVFPGKGMTHSSEEDKEAWNRYSSDRRQLRGIASRIRELAAEADISIAVPVDGEEEVAEGRLLFRMHRSRERDPLVAERKRTEVLLRDGILACEGCGFDFAERYGERGEGFIEVHHLLPLSVGGPRTTKLTDLAVLCANCHRMVHRQEPWLGLQNLRALVRG